MDRLCLAHAGCALLPLTLLPGCAAYAMLMTAAAVAMLQLLI
jgi:hypothetical protein